MLRINLKISLSPQKHILIHNRPHMRRTQNEIRNTHTIKSKPNSQEWIWEGRNMNADLPRCSLPRTTRRGKLTLVRRLSLQLLRPICRLRGNVWPGVYCNVVGFPFIFTSFPLGCVRKHTEGGTGGCLGGAHTGVVFESCGRM